MFMIIWKSYIWVWEDIPERKEILTEKWWHQDGELVFLEGMDLRIGNFGDELLNFLDFWRGRTEIG